MPGLDRDRGAEGINVNGFRQSPEVRGRQEERCDASEEGGTAGGELVFECAASGCVECFERGAASGCVECFFHAASGKAVGRIERFGYVDGLECRDLAELGIGRLLVFGSTDDQEQPAFDVGQSEQGEGAAAVARAAACPRDEPEFFELLERPHD
jgi:hypothetical protein